MSVTIGHASIDENGKACGGAAGDQTGKEVCTRSWYAKGWTHVLRPKDAIVAEKMARACEAGCANNNIGYDQNQRNTLHTLARRNGYDLSAVGKCETDCSAFMTCCAIAAGVTALEHTGNAPTTSTMVNAFVKTGAFDDLTDSKYLTTDSYLKRGDILVKPSSHTVMALSYGSAAKTTVAASTSTTTEKEATCTVELRILKKGKKGEDVRALQRMLIAAGYSCGNCGADGDIVSGTDRAVRSYQSDKGLSVDGCVGTNTWGKLLGA